MTIRLKSAFTKLLLIVCFSLITAVSEAQDDRAQVPPLLNNAYFDVNIGYIEYPFSVRSLENGYNFQSVIIPHPAVRIVLYGHEINRYLSAQISYMRPVYWVKYTYNSGMSGLSETRSVWMNVAGFTLKPKLPLSDHLSLFGEGGLAIITRHGFEDLNNLPVVKNANYATVMAGAGIEYKINPNWHLMLSMVYSPENSRLKQPSTTFYSAGFSYKIHSLSNEKLKKKSETGYIFPKQVIMAGYSSNVLGFGVNDFLTNGKIPVFWSGDTYVQHGISINYLRNIYHGTKVFSLDWGAGMATWKSNITGEQFFTLSIFPVFRWYLMHANAADLYFVYSLAGPSYISRTSLDGLPLGKNFTFQDYMGTGLFLGKEKKLNAEIRISHYSNGNIFTSNAGVTIPLSLHLGFTFK
jgi:hypothetical protein